MTPRFVEKSVSQGSIKAPNDKRTPCAANSVKKVSSKMIHA